jgi:uncharacterized repeat protein (TIGR02543 family)
MKNFILFAMIGIVAALMSCTPEKPDPEPTIPPVTPLEVFCTVTWVLNGGIWPADDDHVTKVEKGKTLAVPKPPTKEGPESFDGWFSDPKFENKVDFPLTVTADITLYARWIAPPQTVDPAKLVGKWELANKDGGLAWVEFSADGYYVAVAEGLTTRQSDEYEDVFFGRYTIEGNEITLAGLGRMTIESLDNEKIVFVLVTERESVIEADATRAATMASTERTDLLCRTWVCTASEVSDPEDTLPTDVGAYYYISKSGTVLAGFDGVYAPPWYWAWEPDSNEKELLLWDVEEGEKVFAEQTTTIERLSATELVILEADEWGWTRSWFKSAE